MTYDDLIMEAESNGLLVKEFPLQSADGRIKGNKIAIREDLETNIEKSCVLAEELGHHYTTVGDILDQDSCWNRKKEQQARLWAYNKKVGLIGLVNAYEHGCLNAHEVAEFLDVTEEFLQETITKYRDKYGVGTFLDNYYICFIPNLQIIKMF